MIVKKMNDSKEHECYMCNKIITCKDQYEIICSCLGVALNGVTRRVLNFFVVMIVFLILMKKKELKKN